MRILHTADWHLGRIFYGVHLTADQEYVLNQFVDVARSQHPDLIVVSGDVYDRAIPPPDAVELLDSVLSRLVLDLEIPTIVIAGNHDSPGRLGFGARMFATRGLHIVGDLPTPFEPLRFEDAHGPIEVTAISYAEPAVVRECYGDAAAEVHDHDSAMQFLTDRIRESGSPEARRVLIAHAFVSGGDSSESERPLTVGGAEWIDPRRFEGFDYVALGHLHRTQSVGENRIHYAGSLMKYSFSESVHEKSVTLVELGKSGDVKTQTIGLSPRREVRCIDGTLADLLKGPKKGENPEDYVSIRLLDKGPVLDAMGRLRAVYPNALHIERPYLEVDGECGVARVDHRKVSDLDLFASFFETVTGEPLSDAERKVFSDVADDLRREEREGVRS